MLEEAVDSHRQQHRTSQAVCLGCKLMSTLVAPVNGRDGKSFEPAKPFQLLFPKKLDLAACAVPIGEPVKERVVYPWVRDYVFPGEADYLEPSAGASDRDRGVADCAIPHFFSHLVIIDNITPTFPNMHMYGPCRPDLALESQLIAGSSHAALVIGGASGGLTLQSSAELAANGSTVLVIEHTGADADRLCAFARLLFGGPSRGLGLLEPASSSESAPLLGTAAEERTEDRGAPSGRLEGSYPLGRRFNPGKYLMFDLLTDSVEVVVSTLMQSLTASAGEEGHKVGFVRSETARLQDAWSLQVKLAMNAERQGHLVFWLQSLILLLGFLTTVLVVLSEFMDTWERHGGGTSVQTWGWATALCCGVLPLVSSLLQSIMGMFSPVNKYAFLNMGAIHVASEIYKYRTRARRYNPHHHQNPSSLTQGGGVGSSSAERHNRPQASRAQAAFASALEHLEGAAVADMTQSSLVLPSPEDFRKWLPQRNRQTQSQERGWQPEDLPQPEAALALDDLVSPLNGSDYFQIRLLPLLVHFQHRSTSLWRLSRMLQVLTFLLTFASGVIAYLGLRLWVPVAVALASVLGSALEFGKVQTRLSNCNQAQLQLESLRKWWESLSLVKQRAHASKEALVDATEANADAEASVWAKAADVRKKDGDDADWELEEA